MNSSLSYWLFEINYNIVGFEKANLKINFIQLLKKVKIKYVYNVLIKKMNFELSHQPF